MAIRKRMNDLDLLHSWGNAGTLYAIGKAADIISNSFFGFDLNQYNSVEHLAAGALIGTAAYRKAGGGLTGILAGFAAATFANVGWEILERDIPNYNGESFEDTLSDVAVVYAGSTLSLLLEKFKSSYKEDRYSQ